MRDGLALCSRAESAPVANGNFLGEERKIGLRQCGIDPRSAPPAGVGIVVGVSPLSLVKTDPWDTGRL